MAFKGYIFNIVRQRASPTEIILRSGHKVTKEESVYFRIPNPDASGPGDWTMIKCADYHGEHFVYLDPFYNIQPDKVDPNKQSTGRGHWFAMCTCGSPAVIISPSEAVYEDSNAENNLLVCYIYHKTLRENGFGTHADQVGRKRWE